MHGVWLCKIHLSYLYGLKLQLGQNCKNDQWIRNLYEFLLWLILRGHFTFFKLIFYSYHWIMLWNIWNKWQNFQPLNLPMVVMLTTRLFTQQKSQYHCIPLIKPEYTIRRDRTIVAIVERFFFILERTVISVANVT